jgi:hypothetical protein
MLPRKPESGMKPSWLSWILGAAIMRYVSR